MRLAVALVVVLAACSDKPSKATPDGSMETDGMTMPDAMDPPDQLTFTEYVIDMVTTQTTATAAPRPYTEFASLIDPDAASNNLAAYQQLF